MALHKDLTGAELHEPKGADSASEGTVYVADGSGSGAWTPVNDGVFNLNQYWMRGEITDISTPNDRAFLYVPIASEMFELAVILDGAITTANSVLSVYVNGVLFADTLTVNFAGSTTGQLQKITFTTTNSVPANSVVEVRTNGGSDTSVNASVFLGLRAVA